MEKTNFKKAATAAKKVNLNNKVSMAKKATRPLHQTINVAIPSDGITVKDGNNMFHISDKSVETIASLVRLVVENPALMKEHGQFLLGIAGKIKYADELLRSRSEKESNLAEFLKVTQPETKSIKDFE